MARHRSAAWRPARPNPSSTESPGIWDYVFFFFLAAVVILGWATWRYPNAMINFAKRVLSGIAHWIG